MNRLTHISVMMPWKTYSPVKVTYLGFASVAVYMIDPIGRFLAYMNVSKSLDRFKHQCKVIRMSWKTVIHRVVRCKLKDWLCFFEASILKLLAHSAKNTPVWSQRKFVMSEFGTNQTPTTVVNCPQGPREAKPEPKMTWPGSPTRMWYEKEETQALPPWHQAFVKDLQGTQMVSPP